jgi:AsmA protein
MKALKIAGAAGATILILIVLVLIVGIPSGFIGPAIEAQVERESGYRLSIAGTTRIGLWPSFNLTINDITLRDPRDRDGSHRVTVGSVQVDMSLSSAWSGHPEIRELIIRRPVIYVPLLRERTRESTASSGPAVSTKEAALAAIDRIRVTDGAVVFSNRKDRIESRIDGIEAEATVGAEGKVTLSGTAHASTHPLKFDVVGEVPAPPLKRQDIPLDLTVEAPDILPAPLSARAELRLDGSVVMFNGVSGKLGDGSFSGWASVDAASKPLLKVDLDFKRLDVALARTPPTESAQPWSNAPFDLIGLNYVDAELRVSAAEISIGEAHFAPAAASATLAGGVLKATVANLGVYGGQANGELIADATSGKPTFAMNCDVAGVSALPLLTSVAGFDKIDGKLQARIAARSDGASQHAIMSNLSGTASANFQDGAIRGISVAQMIRNLTKNPLSGWQEEKEQATDLSQLSASFRIDRGQATTTDLNLVGPLVRVTGAGTIDLPNKSLSFRVEPKLALTTQGQGGTSDPVAFGIPVVIEGPWGEPRIYPDMAGMLDNSEAAYARLREMGKGLFGPHGSLKGILGGSGDGERSDDNGQSGLLGGKLGETLGNLIQQGLSARGHNIPPNSQTDQAPQAPQPGDGAAPIQGPQQEGQRDKEQDSRPMNDLLRQFFNR